MSLEVRKNEGVWAAVQIAIERARLGLKSETTRTRLGFAWWVFEPLILLTIYYTVFGHLLRIQVEDFATFLIIGVTFWTWFNKSVSNCLDSIYEKKHVLEHCRIDPIIFPLTSIFKDLAKEGVVVMLLVVMLFIAGFKPTVDWLYLPILFAIQLVFTAGVGVFVAGVIPFMPDLRIIVSSALQFLMFASGVFYGKENIPADFAFMLDVNPLALLISMYRGVMMYGTAPAVADILFLSALSIFLFFFAVLFVSFNKNSYAVALSK